MEERSQFHAYSEQDAARRRRCAREPDDDADLANAINNIFMHPNVGPFMRSN
jgi:hypothetical protein